MDGRGRSGVLCVVGLVVSPAARFQPRLTGLAATILGIESLVFIAVHAKYSEIAPVIMSGVLALIMAFIAYGRAVLRPIGERRGRRNARRALTIDVLSAPAFVTRIQKK